MCLIRPGKRPEIGSTGRMLRISPELGTGNEVGEIIRSFQVVSASIPIWTARFRSFQVVSARFNLNKLLFSLAGTPSFSNLASFKMFLGSQMA